MGHKDDNFVEYDMDEADIKWLQNFNQGQDRLPPRRFELLIWRLELVNAEANDRHSAATGNHPPSHATSQPHAYLSIQHSLHVLLLPYGLGCILGSYAWV